MTLAGRIQREGDVIHVVARKIFDRTDLLRQLGDIDVDGAFDGMQSRADEMKHPPGKQVPISPREVLVTFPDGRNFR